MKKYLLVEGITDVALVKYICSKKGIINSFDDFVQDNNYYRFNDLTLINLTGQNKLKLALDILKNEEAEISKIGIIEDADRDLNKSKEEIETAIENSKINPYKIKYFLTPNNKDLGDLETMLLSTLDKKNIPQLICFEEYKKCLSKNIDIEKKAMDKAELYAYTMFAEDGKKKYTPQDSFMYKPNKRYNDTGLWDLDKGEFKSIIEFIESIFN